MLFCFVFVLFFCTPHWALVYTKGSHFVSILLLLLLLSSASVHSWFSQQRPVRSSEGSRLISILLLLLFIDKCTQLVQSTKTSQVFIRFMLYKYFTIIIIYLLVYTVGSVSGQGLNVTQGATTLHLDCATYKVSNHPPPGLCYLQGLKPPSTWTVLPTRSPTTLHLDCATYKASNHLPPGLCYQQGLQPPSTWTVLPTRPPTTLHLDCATYKISNHPTPRLCYLQGLQPPST